MKTHSQFEHAARLKYRDFPIKVALAVLSALYIVSFNEEETFTELLQMPNYYRAWGWSTLMAFSIIQAVYLATRWLDKKYLWMISFVKRGWRQLTFSVAFPLLLGVIEAILYFAYYKIHIKNTIYFQKYFVVIVLMVLLLNAYYFFMQWKAFSKITREEWAQKRNEMKIAKDSKLFAMEVVLVYCVKNNIFAVLPNGEEIIWNQSIEDTIKKLPGNVYFKIHRNYIVCRDNIESCVKASSRRRKLTLKVPQGMVIFVSERRVPLFELWFKENSDREAKT